MAEKAAEFSPNAVMIVVSNPLDPMVYTAWKKSGFAPRVVIGMAVAWIRRASGRSWLQRSASLSKTSMRLSWEAAETHGPADSLLLRRGIPVADFISPQRLEEIVQRTRQGGAEIVGLLKTGSAYYAPAASAVQMVRSILLDKKRLLPVAAYLEGEFQEKGIFVGVPAILGSTG